MAHVVGSIGVGYREFEGEGGRIHSFFRFLRHLDLGCSEKQRLGPSISRDCRSFHPHTSLQVLCIPPSGNSGRRVGPAAVRKQRHGSCTQMPSSRYSLDGAPRV